MVVVKWWMVAGWPGGRYARGEPESMVSMLGIANSRAAWIHGIERLLRRIRSLMNFELSEAKIPKRTTSYAFESQHVNSKGCSGEPREPAHSSEIITENCECY